MDSREFQIRLQAFSGPLDLLLHLVRKNEVDLLDIPIALLARQYFEHVSVLEFLDFETAGDFLVMAATLVEWKSEKLLPRKPDRARVEEPDVGSALVEQLIEFRKFKKASRFLEELGEKRGLSAVRQAVHDSSRPGAAVRQVEIWDLVNAFGRIVREHARKDAQVIQDDTPQAWYEERVLFRLAAEGTIVFEKVFEEPFIKPRLIGFFLAVLELIKQRKVELRMDGESIVVAAAPVPYTSGDEPLPQDKEIA